MFLLQPERPSFAATQKTEKTTILYILIFIFLEGYCKTKDSGPSVSRHTQSSVRSLLLQERNLEPLGLFPSI